MSVNQLGSNPPQCRYCDERYFLKACVTCRQAICSMHRSTYQGGSAGTASYYCDRKCQPPPPVISAATKVRLYSFTFYLLVAILIFTLYYLGKV